MSEERALIESKAVRTLHKPKQTRLGTLIRLRFNPAAPLTDDLFAAICAENDELRLERTARGNLEIMAPAGGESSRKNSELTYQLQLWSKTEGRGLGVVLDSSGGIVLPNGAIRSPDASWISLSRWESLTPDQRDKFLPLCPDFVVELRSKTDKLSKLRKKMAEYIEQGARLGWLIDPIRGVVEVFRAGKGVEILVRPATLSGEDLLPSLTLNLNDILKG